MHQKTGQLAITTTYSQNLDYHNKSESIKICTAIQGNNFGSNTDADAALDEILNVINDYVEYRNTDENDDIDNLIKLPNLNEPSILNL